MAVEWFYLRAGQIVGPLTAAQIRDHALARKVTPEHHVRRGEVGEWVRAAKVKGLFDAVLVERPDPVIPPSSTHPQPNAIQSEVTPSTSTHHAIPASASYRPSMPLGWVVAGVVTLLAAIGYLYMNQQDKDSTTLNYPSSSGGRGSVSRSRLTADNFLRTKPGMNHQDVTLILGQPTRTQGSTEIGIRLWTWTEGSREIAVAIDNDGNVDAKTQKGLN